MTLRSRLAVVYAVAVVAVVVTGATVVLTQRQYLMDQVDSRLRGAAAPVVRADPFGAPGPVVAGPANTLWVGEVDPRGELRTLPSVLDEGDAPDVTGAELLRSPLGEPFTVGSESGGSGYRMLVAQPLPAGSPPPSEPGDPEGQTLQPSGPAGPRMAFALPLEDLDSAVGRLAAVLGWGALGILAVLALSGWWVWRLGLRPIREMTAAADRIAAGGHDLGVPVAPAGTEAGALAVALNQMLESRRRSEEQLRRFVGDASHELRTPLTSVRGYAELYERGALGDPGDLDDAMRRILAESDRMAELIEDLLLLARLDQGRPLELGPVDLGAVLEDLASDARAVDPDRDIGVEVEGSADVVGDENRLRQVLAGLVSNALVHTDAPIHLRARMCSPGWACVEVVDQGPGMEEDTARRAFDRFYRGDPARSRHTGGSGLGLAIARSVVEAHGGGISLRTAPGRGCCVEIRLPADPPARRALGEHDVSREPPGTVQR